MELETTTEMPSPGIYDLGDTMSTRQIEEYFWLARERKFRKNWCENPMWEQEFQRMHAAYTSRERAKSINSAYRAREIAKLKCKIEDLSKTLALIEAAQERYK